MSSTAGPCTASIQDKIYNEEQAAGWWYAIQSDLNTLNQALSLEEDACIDCRQELLDGLGVDRTYMNRYGGFDSGCQYSSSADYPLIVSATRGDTFYIAPLSDDMETPAEVRMFLYDAWKGPQLILGAMKADAPEYADILAQNYMAPISYYVEDRTI